MKVLQKKLLVFSNFFGDPKIFIEVNHYQSQRFCNKASRFCEKQLAVMDMFWAKVCKETRGIGV